MAEETAAVANQAPTGPSITTEKNGVNMVIKPIAETRGKGVGSVYYGTEPFSLVDLTKLMGEDFLAKKGNAILKSHLKDCYEMTFCTNPKAETKDKVYEAFDASKMEAAWKEWSFITESLKVLKDRQQALVYQMLDLPDDNSDEAKQKAASLKQQIQAVRKSIEQKSRSKDEDDEDESEVAPAATA